LKRPGKPTKADLLAVLVTIRHEMAEVFKSLPTAKSTENDSREKVLSNLDTILKNHKTAPDISKIYDIFKL